MATGYTRQHDFTTDRDATPPIPVKADRVDAELDAIKTSIDTIVGSNGTTTAMIADLAITTAKIADDAVTTAKIADGAVTSAKFADASISSAKLADNSVTTAKITDANVTTAKIADSNVTTAKLADSSVTTAKIADVNVTTAKIADANVTTGKIADDAVTTAKITNANVTTTKIADSNVTTAKIADDAVTTAKIPDSNVTTAKIADANVTTAKIADSAVTTAKVADVNITSGKIADGAVAEAKIADTAVTSGKLADNSVTTAKITDGNVTTAKLTDSSVTTAKIADSAITNAKLPSGMGLDASKIADGSVSNAEFQALNGGMDATKIADGSVTNTEFQYLDGTTSNLQGQFDSLVDPGFSVDETNTNTAKNKFVSNNLAKGWEDTKTAFDAGTQAVPLTMDHESTPSAPASGKNKLYFKNDGKLYKIDSGGSEAQVGGDSDAVVTNTSDIFTTNVRLIEQHGTSAYLMERGFTDELVTSNDMIDESASTGYTYNATDDYYQNTAGSTGQPVDHDYNTESESLQLEYTKTNLGAGNITVADGPHTVTAAGGAKLMTIDYVGNKAMTMSNATLSSTQKVFGDTSLKVDSSSDHVSTPDHNDFDLPSNSAWQFKWRQYATQDLATAVPHIIAGNGYQAGNGYILNWYNNAGQRRFRFTTSGADAVFDVTSGEFGQDSWIACCVSFDGTNLRFYIDGSQIGSATSLPSISASSNVFKVGYSDYWEALQGYIDEFMFQLGGTVETGSSYTVETAQFTANAYTKLLLHFDGTDGDTSTIDSTGTEVSPKFGTAMGKFEGTESANWDCVTVPDHADWRLGADGDGTGVFTIECWHYKTQTGSTDTMISHGNDANDYWTFLTTGTALVFQKTVSGSETVIKSENTNGGSNIAINQWWNFKLTRDDSDNIHMYLNGVELGSGTSHADAIPDFSGTLAIGAQDRNGTIQTGLNGYLDDVRISNSDRGSGQPSAKLITDANTKLLLSMDGSGTTFVDSSYATHHFYVFINMPSSVTNTEFKDENINFVSWTGSAWKPVIRYVSSGTKFQKNTHTGSGSDTTWADCTGAGVSNVNHAISEALSNTALQMREADVEGISDSNWSSAFTAGTTAKVSMSVTMKSESTTGNSTTDLVQFNYDSNNSEMTLISKQWDGSTGRPSAPASAPAKMYLFVVDEQTTGTPNYYVSRDGTNWSSAITFDASWAFGGITGSGTNKTARRAVVDVSGLTSGTNPKLKLVSAQGNLTKLHAVGLQTRSG